MFSILPPKTKVTSHKPAELYRHGDVLIQRVNALPIGAKANPIKNTILVRGEVTGHSHRIAESDVCKLYFHQYEHQKAYRFDQYLEVLVSSVRLIHEEHKTIELLQGIYRYWRQREYAPEGNYWVRD